MQNLKEVIENLKAEQKKQGTAPAGFSIRERVEGETGRAGKRSGTAALRIGLLHDPFQRERKQCLPDAELGGEKEPASAVF